MEDRFTIRFERSGGFAGIITGNTIDSLQLKRNESKMLQSMIEDACFFSLPAGKITANQPDRFSYKITIESAGKKHMVEFSQESVPEGLKNLVQYLKKKTRLKK